MEQVNNALLDELIYKKRTVVKFHNKDIPDELVKKLYDLTSHGATAFNSQPARFIFIKSKEAKERLKPFLMAGNVDKVMNAPLTVIVATDYQFYNKLDITFPVADVKGLFIGNSALTEKTAFRNSTLSGGYLISAAHALGLDTAAMSGFDNTKVDEEFFPNSNIKSNFIINIGYGNYEGIPGRLPRLAFEETSQII